MTTTWKRETAPPGETKYASSTGYTVIGQNSRKVRVFRLYGPDGNRIIRFGTLAKAKKYADEHLAMKAREKELKTALAALAASAAPMQPVAEEAAPAAPVRVPVERPELGTVTEGQKVIVVRSANDSRRRAPEDRFLPGTVVKAGPVWLTISVQNGRSTRTLRMRRDTQDEAGRYPNSNWSFRTLEQHAWRKAADHAFQVLQKAGIELRFSSPWRGREIELVRLIESAEGSGE